MSISETCKCGGWELPLTAFAVDPMTKQQIPGVAILVPCPRCGTPAAFMDPEMAEALARAAASAAGKGAS